MEIGGEYGNLPLSVESSLKAKICIPLATSNGGTWISSENVSTVNILLEMRRSSSLYVPS